ncbi:hypothetical protein [Candidatus Nitrospira neomarina]|uniref:Uncharacterized protein n=1 Tax=Candidatus Nitrospira neomarina TaxID=3020899 RepID=A0AA96JYX2_9BACT|nr:hypothetical protein [Candidatus Nitrospira neomarina]WNM60586.1 hypothetical protein PQG83_12540 [Candidatus Nitrospira neomarina]
MTPEVQNAAIGCLEEGTQKIINLYTYTALLLNACDVAAKGYEARKDNFQLSTTMYIPDSLRLPVEVERKVEVVFHRNDLPGAYRGEAPKKLAEDFIIRMVAVMDDVLEDIYEKTLPLVFPDLSEADITKKVRASWCQDKNEHVNIFNFLVNDAGLKSPKGRRSTLDMVFDRYYEMREIRHAIVHSAGILSEKSKVRLNSLAERLPKDLRTGSLALKPFLADGVVKLTGLEILMLRHWAYTTIMDYLKNSFKESGS